MRHALIIAGGSGTRLWPMSRRSLPKQLIPFIRGDSLLRIAWNRLDGLVPPERRWICAGEVHRQAILATIPELDPARYLGEPAGRDTMAALGLSAAVIGAGDPEALIAVFTADHTIEPAERLREAIDRGFGLAEDAAPTIVTFGVTPAGPSTAYGYLQLGDPLQGAGGGARIVDAFREKPDLETARGYFAAGPDRFLWNSGMFVWRASAYLDCVDRYHPDVAAGLRRAAAAWSGPHRPAVLAEVYPALPKVSVDFGVMEPASRDTAVRIAALPLPLPLRWIDVGSWNAFAETCPRDEAGNAIAAARAALLGSVRTLAASSDPGHLIAAVGCEDLIIVHTPDATLVCRADRAEAVKELHRIVGERFGEDHL